MTPKEAKNYVAGTLERDQPYERLLRQVVLEGELTHDRTGVGTLSTFGTRMEFNLQDGFPLVTTKKVFLSIHAVYGRPIVVGSCRHLQSVACCRPRLVEAAKDG